MKTVLIDRSLVNTKFNKNLSEDKKIMFMYVCALIEAGASYIELDFNSVVKLPKPSGAENYIFRINSPEEFVVANSLNFSYAVLPLKFTYILPKLELPVILEIETGDSDVFDVLQVVSSNIDLSAYNMIRLIGDFEPDLIPSIISTYRRRSVIPLDICPKNTMLTALNSAIASFNTDADMSGSDAVTVKFSEYEEFASLEELLIMLSSLHRTVISPNYLEGICKASLFFALFAESKTSNLSMMMRKYMHGPLKIENIDIPTDTNDLELKRLLGANVRINSSPNTSSRSPASRVLNSLGIEREMSDQIIRILEDCNIDILDISMIGNINKDEELQ